VLSFIQQNNTGVVVGVNFTASHHAKSFVLIVGHGSPSNSKLSLWGCTGHLSWCTSRTSRPR